MKKHKLTAVLLAATALTAMSVQPALAQGQDDSIKQIERYREMIADGNPAELVEVRGEALWKQK